MKKPIPKIRVFGQQTIDRSLLNRSSIPWEDSSENQSKKVEKCISFSEFLDKKLNKSVPSKAKNKEEGSTPFTTLGTTKDLTQLSHGFGMEKKAKEETKTIDSSLEKAMLQQFKPKKNQISKEMSKDVTGKASLEPLDQTTTEEIDLKDSYFTEINEDGIVKDNIISRKRKDPFEGMERMKRTGKSVIILGENSRDSKPMQAEGRRGTINSSYKKQRPAYNHYESGSGWWDNNMEGVDSEEVGHGEVWEGVGSTTYGDTVDWH